MDQETIKDLEMQLQIPNLGKIKDRELLKWEPRRESRRYVEDILFERRIIEDFDISDQGFKGLSVILQAMKSIQNLEVFTDKKLGQELKTERPDTLFGLLLLQDFSSKVPNIEKKLQDRSGIEEKEKEAIKDFSYGLSYLHAYFKSNSSNFTKGPLNQVYKALINTSEAFLNNKNKFFSNVKTKTDYLERTVLIDTGSPENFMSLKFARELRAPISNQVIQVMGFTSIKDGAVNTYPTTNLKTLILQKNLETNEIKKSKSIQSYGIIPNFENFIDFDILIGESLLRAIRNDGIVTII